MSGLPQNLISGFVKSVTDNDKKSTPTTAYGIIVMDEGEKKVLLDGSDASAEPIPLISTVLANPGDRVKVTIQNHYAIIDGNITSPAVNKDGVIASINLSGEDAVISASRIDLKGVATFSNGGGVNFLRNTGHVQTWRQLQESTSSFIDDRTVRINKMETDDDWNSGVQTWPRLDTLELIGKTVTLSFWAKVIARPQTIDSQFTITLNTSASSNKTGARAKYKAVSFVFPLYDEETGEFIPIDTWKKFTYTIDNLSEDFFSSGSGGVGAFFYLAIYNRSPNRFYFKDFKIEEGHAATTWSPSPLDDNYSVVENGVTVIDGGKIKTGSVTAEQIDVTSIFAQNITARGDITFKNSKYEISADADTGTVTIQTTPRATGNVPLKIKSWNSLLLNAGLDLTMIADVGEISMSAMGSILFSSSDPSDIKIQTGAGDYPIGAYTYHAGTSSGKWSYKKWIDGTIDLWCYVSVSTTCPNDFGGGLKMSDPISIPDYPFTLSNVRDTQIYFQTSKEGTGAFVWTNGLESKTHPGAIRLVRPTNVTVAGYVYVSVKGVI